MNRWRSSERDQTRVRWVQHGVSGGGDAGQAFEQSWRWGVEVLVRNAVDAVVADCAERLPVTQGDDFGERDAVTDAAPGEEQNVRVGCGYFFRRGVRAGRADEGCAGGFDELSDPVL